MIEQRNNQQRQAADSQPNFHEASFPAPITHPFLEELYANNVHTLVLFRVTQEIPVHVWDYLPYKTKIPADFQEFTRGDMGYSLDNNLEVMKLALCGATLHDKLFHPKGIKRAVVAIHGDPTGEQQPMLRIKNISSSFQSRFPDSWKQIAMEQGSAYLNEFLYTLAAGYSRGPTLNIGGMQAAVLLPPEHLDLVTMPPIANINVKAKQLMAATLQDSSLPKYTEVRPKWGVSMEAIQDGNDFD